VDASLGKNGGRDNKLSKQACPDIACKHDASWLARVHSISNAETRFATRTAVTIYLVLWHSRAMTSPVSQYLQTCIHDLYCNIGACTLLHYYGMCLGRCVPMRRNRAFMTRTKDRPTSCAVWSAAWGAKAWPPLCPCLNVIDVATSLASAFNKPIGNNIRLYGTW